MRYTKRVGKYQTHRTGQDYKLIDPNKSIEAKNELGRLEDLMESYGINRDELGRILWNYFEEHKGAK